MTRRSETCAASGDVIFGRVVANISKARGALSIDDVLPALLSLPLTCSDCWSSYGGLFPLDPAAWVSEKVESWRLSCSTSFSSSEDLLLFRIRLKRSSILHWSPSYLNREHESGESGSSLDKPHLNFCCLHSLHAHLFWLPMRAVDGIPTCEGACSVGCSRGCR